MVESFKQHLHEKKRNGDKDVHQLFKESRKEAKSLMQKLRKIQEKVNSDAAKQDIGEYADAIQEALDNNMVEVRDLLRIIKASQQKSGDNSSKKKKDNGNKKDNKKKEDNNNKNSNQKNKK